MEVKELKNQSVKELHRLLAEKRDEWRECRHKVSERQLGKVRKIRELRQDIARILTVINAKRAEDKSAV